MSSRLRLNRTQRLVLGFFVVVWAAFVVILVAAPAVYDQALRLPGGEHELPVLGFLAAISTFLVLLVIGVVRRWRWTFWLILGAFLIGGVLRVPASILQLSGSLPADFPAWYLLLQALIGLVQVAIGLAMLVGYRKAGTWGASNSFNLEYRPPATAGHQARIDFIAKRPGGTESMFASITRPLRWPKRIVVVTAAIFVLQQLVVRILRRVAPGPMPPGLAPLLAMRWRSQLFGTPERVLDRAGVTPGMRVLEVGPGPGVYTVPLARRVAVSGEDGRVTCLEVQPQMIEMLRERLRAAGVPNVEVVQGDGRQMPFPDDSFDMVFLVDVVGEIPDKPAFFGECARVLEPGGILAVTEQISDPDFRVPSTIQTLATEAGLREDGLAGLPWWTYTARYRK